MPDSARLRILHLITDLAKGGAERFLIDLCGALQRRDDVEFAIGVLYDNDQYAPLTDGLPIHPLDFETFSLRRGGSCPKYRDLLDAFRPDVVHTHRFLAEFLSSYYVSPDIAYVCHGHDNMVQLANPGWSTLFDRTELTQFLEKRHLTRAKYSEVPTAFIANSTHTLDYYRRVLPRHMREDVHLIRYGFDYDRFSRRSAAPRPGGGPLQLVNVGSFQKKKNQVFVVDIARELEGRGLDFEFHLLGDGDERPTVEAAVEAAGLSGRIRFHGNVQRVEERLWRSDLYVHTAWYEPFGLVFLEAMAAGLPCVTLNGKGNKDLIEQGRNGYLLEEQDAAAFADRIMSLASDHDLYERMSRYAQEYARGYDIDRAAADLVDFYRSRVRSRARQITSRDAR